MVMLFFKGLVVHTLRDPGWQELVDSPVLFPCFLSFLCDSPSFAFSRAWLFFLHDCTPTWVLTLGKP